MTFNLFDAFTGRIDRLDHVLRCSASTVTGTRESVSQHQFWVAFHAVCIAMDIRDRIIE